MLRKLILFCLSFATLSLSAFSQNRDIPLQKVVSDGAEIIRKSRETVGIEKIKLKSIHYKVKTLMLGKTPNGASIPEFLADISFTLPDKIQSNFSFGPPMSATSIKTWNGEKYKSISEIEMLGQRIVKDDTKDELNPDRNKSFGVLEGKIDKGNLNALKNAKRQDPKKILLESMWTELFPLILTHPFEQDVKFNYVGKAKANNVTANVVDFKPENGKSYRLLFDAETNYLLMMIVTYKRNDSFFVGDAELKYYFSDRQLSDGVLIPRKIKVENKQTAAGKPPTINYQNLDILEFKLNPEFKENMFEIK